MQTSYLVATIALCIITVIDIVCFLCKVREKFEPTLLILIIFLLIISSEHVRTCIAASDAASKLSAISSDEIIDVYVDDSILAYYDEYDEIHNVKFKHTNWKLIEKYDKDYKENEVFSNLPYRDKNFDIDQNAKTITVTYCKPSWE